MATFQAQVQALTGVTIDGNLGAPSTTELNQFLRDAALDVTHRWLAVKPDDVDLFTRVSADTTSNDSLSVHGARIISVVREAGVANDWRTCRYILPDFQSRVTDVDSIHYASKYNPAYTVLENGQISVFPAPGSNPDEFKAYYINNDPVDNDDNNLAYNSNSIKYFPDDKIYLVAIYAAIKTLEAKMAFYATDEEDLELVQSIQANIGQLNKIYDEAFGLVSMVDNQRREAQ